MFAGVLTEVFTGVLGVLYSVFSCAFRSCPSRVRAYLSRNSQTTDFSTEFLTVFTAPRVLVQKPLARCFHRCLRGFPRGLLVFLVVFSGSSSNPDLPSRRDTLPRPSGRLLCTGSMSPCPNRAECLPYISGMKSWSARASNHKRDTPSRVE